MRSDRRPSATATTATTPTAAATESDSQLARSIRAELKALLDAVPASRSVLPHLAAVEQVLKSQGLEGVEALPLAALEKARAQLASLPLGAQHTRLPHLLSLLDLLIETLQAPPADRPSDQFLSSFLTDDKLVVGEASHSEFIELLGDGAAPDKG